MQNGTSRKELTKLGGIEGLAKALKTDLNVRIKNIKNNLSVVIISKNMLL